MPDGFMRLSLNANAFIGLGSLALRFSASLVVSFGLARRAFILA